MGLDQELSQALAKRREQHLYRHRITHGSAAGPLLTVDGQPLLCFCANDYLGLANHPKVIEAMTATAKQYGLGSAASHLVAGHSLPHHQLEEALAEYTGCDRALVFSTGFMANSGVISSLVGAGDAVFEDKLNHASLIDAGLHSGAKFSRYLHNDVESLSKKLVNADAKRKLVVTDGVFSMDGDAAPVSQLIDLCAANNAHLMVDDAHGFGVINNGLGFAEYSQKQLPIYMATLGKALGGFGAFVAGSDALIETLIQFARSYIYTTAMPPAVAAANLAALNIMRQEPDRIAYLHSLIAQFKHGAAARGISLMQSNTAIQPIMVGEEQVALAMAEQLKTKGFWVSAIRPPTVPPGTARLRVTLSAAHTSTQVESLLNALAELNT